MTFALFFAAFAKKYSGWTRDGPYGPPRKSGSQHARNHAHPNPAQNDTNAKPSRHYAAVAKSHVKTSTTSCQKVSGIGRDAAALPAARIPCSISAKQSDRAAASRRAEGEWERNTQRPTPNTQHPTPKGLFVWFHLMKMTIYCRP